LAGGSSFPVRAVVSGQSAYANDTFAALSPRERQVLQALLAGTSLQELALGLQLSTKTLSTYRARLLSKLGVRSNAELVALAICHGYA
jgi:DNA-binding NarL/FixJ family response regulator